MGKRKTHEQFIKEVYDLVKVEYEVLGRYKNSKTKIEMKHNCDDCNNHKFLMTPNNFSNNGQRCPACNGTHKKTTEQFKKEVYNIVGGEYIVIGEYISNKTSIPVFHTICNKIVNIIPYHFLNSNTRCSECYGNVRKTDDSFKKEIYKLIGDEYVVSSAYVNNRTKIGFTHKKCNKISYITPSDFMFCDSRCQHCKPKISKGEKLIGDFLYSIGVIHEKQFSFDDCKRVNKLPFDFAIFNKENKLTFLIEYDGIQHFEPQDFAGKGEEWAISNFKETLIKDEIRNKYCKDSNIPLLRIPYWEFNNIELILENELNKCII